MSTPETPSATPCPHCGGPTDALLRLTGGLPPDDEGRRFCHECLVVVPPAPAAPSGEDAANLAGLITMCRDLKQRLMPFGASEAGWDSAIDTLVRMVALRDAADRLLRNGLVAPAGDVFYAELQDVAALRAATYPG